MKAWFFLIPALTLSLTACSRAPSRDDALEALADRASRLTQAGVVPGIAMAVVEPGAVIWSGGFGFADMESGTAMAPDMVMPIGSISKVFVGAAAAHLIAEDQLQLSSTVAQAWPQAPATVADLTLGQLVTHTSGIEDTPVAYDEDAYAYDTLRHPEALDAFLTSYLAADGARYDPSHIGGSTGSYSYTNVGAALAGQMIGAAAGDLTDLSRDLTFDPVGMTATSWDARDVPQDTRITLYESTDEGRKPLPPYALATWPDGGLHSSANDLARFMAAVMGGGMLDGTQVIPAAEAALLTTPIIGPDAPGMADNDMEGVGLFWSLEGLGMRPLFWLDLEGHNGGDPGLFTAMYKEPGGERGIILMVNGHPESTRDVVRLANLLKAGFAVP